MGIITILTQMTVYGGLGLAAAKAREFLITSPNITIGIEKSAGALFIVVAFLTLWRALAH